VRYRIAKGPHSGSRTLTLHDPSSENAVYTSYLPEEILQRLHYPDLLLAEDNALTLNLDEHLLQLYLAVPFQGIDRDPPTASGLGDSV
jgi:hypothetical protein